MRISNEKYQQRMASGAQAASIYTDSELLEMARGEAEWFNGIFTGFSVRITAKSATLIVNYRNPNGHGVTAHIAL